MKFKWNWVTAEVNRDKHGVAFEEAATCFNDRHQLVFYDPDHSDDEHRELLIAHSNIGRLLLVSYTVRGSSIRIISARRGTKLRPMRKEYDLRSLKVKRRGLPAAVSQKAAPHSAVKTARGSSGRAKRRR